MLTTDEYSSGATFLEALFSECGFDILLSCSVIFMTKNGLDVNQRNFLLYQDAGI